MGNKASSFDSGTLKMKFSSSLNNSRDFKYSPKRGRFYSSDSDDPWGWFEDFESPSMRKCISKEVCPQPLQRAVSLPPPVAQPPLYILESSLQTQQLWYTTAGQRPQQPENERKYFERLWSKNFEASAVNYDDEESDPAVKKIKLGDKIPKSEFNGEVVFKGKSPFTNSVSKSFSDHIVPSITIQLPYYRIFRTEDGSLHAEYLVLVSLGNHGAMTFGVWKRHSDFVLLAENLHEINVKSEKLGTFKNAMLSWQCLIQRKRWFKCLDKDYLALKCFLLERFLHDVLFESQSPAVISEFLGID